MMGQNAMYLVGLVTTKTVDMNINCDQGVCHDKYLRKQLHTDDTQHTNLNQFQCTIFDTKIFYFKIICDLLSLFV